VLFDGVNAFAIELLHGREVTAPRQGEMKYLISSPGSLQP
jgi:hypothetical protein